MRLEKCLLSKFPLLRFPGHYNRDKAIVHSMGFIKNDNQSDLNLSAVLSLRLGKFAKRVRDRLPLNLFMMAGMVCMTGVLSLSRPVFFRVGFNCALRPGSSFTLTGFMEMYEDRLRMFPRVVVYILKLIPVKIYETGLNIF